jgi:hypothetical protein
VAGELPETERFVVRLPPEFGLGRPLEQPSSGAHLVVELREQGVPDGHGQEYDGPT